MMGTIRLTYQTLALDQGQRDRSAADGFPFKWERKMENEKDEIEITPEMIEAGARELAMRDAHDTFTSTARAVFLSMLRGKKVAPSPHAAPPPRLPESHE